MTPNAVLINSHRDVELDELRGVAVGMVLAWHFIGIPAWSTEGWLPQAVFRVFLLGGAGVDLFFVLSGFLVTRIVISRKQSDTRFLMAFYARRALRILPPYLLLVAVFWAVVWAGVRNDVFNNDIALWRFLTFTQNFWMADRATYGPDGISVTWSVAIEEQYYLAFPLLVILLPKGRLPAFLTIITLASVTWRAYIFALDPSNNYPSDLGTFARLDGLAAGGLIACAFDNPDWAQWLRGHRAGLRRAMLWSLASLIFVRRDSGVQMAFFGHTMLTICFALVTTDILLNLGANSQYMRFLRSSGLRFLGKISYSLYLFHPIVLATAFLLTGYPKTLGGWPQVLILTTCLVLTIGFCNLLFNRFESRIIGFGRKMPY